jgi:hypothetical protein
MMACLFPSYRHVEAKWKKNVFWDGFPIQTKKGKSISKGRALSHLSVCHWNVKIGLHKNETFAVKHIKLLQSFWYKRNFRTHFFFLYDLKCSPQWDCILWSPLPNCAVSMAASVEHFALFVSPESGGNTYDRLSSWNSNIKQPKSH